MSTKEATLQEYFHTKYEEGKVDEYIQYAQYLGNTESEVDLKLFYMEERKKIKVCTPTINILLSNVILKLLYRRNIFRN